MSIDDIKWSPSEKKVAREIFNSALNKEMEEIKSLLNDKVKNIKNHSDIWELEDFLSKRRKRIDSKYDYRYSRLLTVFGILLSEGYLSESDLNNLDDEKIEIIKKYSSFY